MQRNTKSDTKTEAAQVTENKKEEKSLEQNGVCVQ